MMITLLNALRKFSHLAVGLGLFIMTIAMS